MPATHPASVFFLLTLPLVALLSQVSAGPTHDAWSRLWKPCPRSCGDLSPAEWAVYNRLDHLSACNQTIRLEFPLYNPSGAIRACSASSDSQSKKAAQGAVSPKKFAAEEVTLKIGWWDTETSSTPTGVKSAIGAVRNALLASNNNESTTAFSYSGNSLVGLYAGQKILHSDAATTALKQFTQYVESQDAIGRVLLQYWGINGNKGFGIVVDTTGDLAAVQRIMRDWNDAKCQTGFDGSKKLSNTALHMEKPLHQASSTTGASVHQTPSHSAHPAHSHNRRATCETIQVASGDTCESLAKECGITDAKFEEYNPDKDLCSSISVGQHVCCTTGDLPSFSRKAKADGTCDSVVVKPGHYCSTIAAANDITVDDLEEFNKKTWGWVGCDNLQAQQRICISKGDPPMPASVDNAVCGPQVPGTEKPTDGKDLADLNPCPLQTCCNIWGQCGITDDFCTETKSPTGAPGTAANGTNGCISNCGTDIVNNDSAPDEFITIGYFEAWNFERECLNMDITFFNSAEYSHLHFAFAEITEDYQVDISPVQEQFDKLLKLGSVHRVLSFGGWSFSTEADSFPIFREGVTDANRELFATNVVDFIVEHDLEGVDFDWEYPGAPDIPGIPAGDEGDGERYLQFLKLVRKKLPKSKTLAIAAPASFWYLKGFPIAEISDVVDYIVYMAYDMHGQWGYGNQYAISGCHEGDCLRSHVNLTETTSALSMITKAGVPSSKIIVGLSSYGRSFKMTKAGCTGPMCRFVGPDSGAAPGKCTNTAGYISDAEINQIIAEDSSAATNYDTSSNSNILVYNSTEWVAYMDDDTRTSRTEYYEELNMGGTSDWAVDLQSFGGSDGGSSGDNGLLNQSIVYISPSIWTDGKDPAPVQCPAPCVLVLPDFPLSSTSVVSRPPYVTTLDVAWPTAKTVTSDGSVTTTTTVTRILQETTIKAPAVTVSSVPMANINITVPLKENGTITITPKPRFPAQTVTVTNDPNPLKETGVTHPPVTRSVTLPPWPQGTVIYYPSDDIDDDDDDDDDDDGNDDDDDGDDDDDNNDDNDDNDDDDHIGLPIIPHITVNDGPGRPRCSESEGCGHLCSGSIDYCSCFMCPGGGDGGFSDPSDPNPPPRPPSDPVNNNNENESSCSESSTATDYWVSCESLESTSTSCTTTSSRLAVGCDITASTTTTGENVCATFDPDEDQGDSNGGVSGGGPTPITTETRTDTDTETATEPTITTTFEPPVTATTSKPPAATVAESCADIGDYHGKGLCWNKCDPDTGSTVGDDWKEDDPWCYLQKDGDPGYDAWCYQLKDCPTGELSCSDRSGCLDPKAIGCAALPGTANFVYQCWSSCDPATGNRTNDEWKEGDPWCWITKNYNFLDCEDVTDCSAASECAAENSSYGGCGPST